MKNHISKFYAGKSYVASLACISQTKIIKIPYKNTGTLVPKIQYVPVQDKIQTCNFDLGISGLFQIYHFLIKMLV